MKIVINRSFGGFGLSFEAVLLYAKIKNIKLYPYKIYQADRSSAIYKKVYHSIENDCIWLLNDHGDIYINKGIHYDIFSPYCIDRADMALVEAVHQLGERASGVFSKLKIIELPDNADYSIRHRHGMERIIYDGRSYW